VFTARYALSPHIKQIRFVFKRLILTDITGNFYLVTSFLMGRLSFQVRVETMLFKIVPILSDRLLYLAQYTSILPVYTTKGTENTVIRKGMKFVMRIRPP
jgi:hypothetical protein